jgi:hypothetical protein
MKSHDKKAGRRHLVPADCSLHLKVFEADRQGPEVQTGPRTLRYCKLVPRAGRENSIRASSAQNRPSGFRIGCSFGREEDATTPYPKEVLQRSVSNWRNETGLNHVYRI